MRASVVLDTSFLINLAKFDQYSRVQKAGAIHPYDGLNHLMHKGATLVLPNDVLKALTFVPSLTHADRCLGLGKSDSGAAFLSAKALKDCKSPYPENAQFLEFLADQYRQNNIRCFASAEAYEQASNQAKLAGKIVIVATDELARGKGMEQLTSQPKLQDERGAMKIAQARTHQSPPHCLLTCNTQVAEQFRQASTVKSDRTLVLFLRPYVEMLTQLGFDKRSLQMADHVSQDTHTNIPMGQPMRDVMHERMTQFVEKCERLSQPQAPVRPIQYVAQRQQGNQRV